MINKIKYNEIQLYETNEKHEKNNQSSMFHRMKKPNTFSGIFLNKTFQLYEREGNLRIRLIGNISKKIFKKKLINLCLSLIQTFFVKTTEQIQNFGIFFCWVGE